MQILTLSDNIDSDGHLRLDLPTQLPEGNVEIVVVINPAPDQPKRKKYDFSDLAGTLTCQEDPLVLQQKMRDAW